MSHLFSQVPKAEIQRSAFDRSHGYKTTCDSGYLVPIELQEVLPGDTVTMKATVFARLTTQVAPIMSNLYADVMWFFVPTRLLWNHWEQFNGAQVNPDDTTDYTIPQVVAPSGGFVVGSLADYLGVKTGVAALSVNALPFRAYQLIWDQWFRDENLQDSVMATSSMFGDGPDTVSTMNVLQRRGKRHDYFTSCLPWPQKGPGVNLPLGGTAAVKGDGKSLGITNGYTLGVYGAYGLVPSGIDQGSAAGTTFTQYTAPSSFYTMGVTTDGTKSGLIADLSTATAVTINSLRQAFQLQRLYERDARGGTRYVEILKAHFGVTSPDARLQRAEFLAGSSTPVHIQTVVCTAQNSPVSIRTRADYLGSLGANGLVSGSSGFTKSFVEHGYLIGLIEFRADLDYQQGLDRLWSRKTRFDFYWPALSHLGEQAVLNKEIYCQGPNVKDSDNNVIDDLPFGYQERYAEYRYAPNRITGQFRSDYVSSLDVWHLAQKFTSLPTLGADFIQDNPPVSRTLALTDYPQWLLDVDLRQRWVRPMPCYSVPGLVDHL